MDKADNSNGDNFNAKLHRMTTQPVEGLVVRMAVPTITIMLISAFYNMADTYFVGNLGTSATAAVGVCFSLMAVIQAIGFFFGHGSGNYISRRLGAGRFDEATHMAGVGFISAWLAGALLAVTGLAFIQPLALLLGSTPTILPHAVEYLTFILIAAPWMAATLTINNLLRFQGSAFYGMIGVGSGAVLNVILDPIFIFGLDMGVAGASLATCISQFVSFCLLWRGCARGGNIAVHVFGTKPKLQDYREILRGGFPSLCRQGLAAVSALVLNHTAGQFGDAAIAAMSIVQRVIMFANSALIGWGQGFQPVCGFNYGAGLYSRVKRAYWFCIKSSTIFLLVVAGIAIALAPGVIEIFRRDDPEVIAIGSVALRFQAMTMPVLGLMVLTNMLLQTIGKAVPASLLAMAGHGLFLLPALLLLTPWLGILGLQLAQPVTTLATMLLSIPFIFWIMRELAVDAPNKKADPELLVEQIVQGE